MSATRAAIQAALDELMGPLARMDDYGPNGLQVEGSDKIETLVTGVTASLDFIQAATQQGPQALLVHHGLFWKGAPVTPTGMLGTRIKALMDAKLNLWAYHLPLDAHPTHGNNVRLAQLLGLEKVDLLAHPSLPQGMIWQGVLPKPMTGESFANHLASTLQHRPLHIEPQFLRSADEPIQTIALCTGGAQRYLPLVAELGGLDAYISGEISEPTVHIAREQGLHYFAAGHHATEREGVKAVGDYLAQKLGIRHLFIDRPIPV